MPSNDRTLADGYSLLVPEVRGDELALGLSPGGHAGRISRPAYSCSSVSIGMEAYSCSSVLHRDGSLPMAVARVASESASETNIEAKPTSYLTGRARGD